MPDRLLAALCVLIPAAPASVFGFLTLGFLGDRPPSERVTGRLVLGSLAVSLTCVLVLVGAWMVGTSDTLIVQLGHWFEAGDHAFVVAYAVDRLSATMLPLVGGVTLVVCRFAVPYMHREPGFARFFAQLSLFAAGMFVVVLAGSADLLLVGWECVGVASAMLVTFFQERSGPARAATRVFITYRLCDVGLLVGTMMLHVFFGTSEFRHVFGGIGWPGSAASVDPVAATFIGTAFAVAAIGKSAQLPVGGWLPRAMEGPTPSSALFYGGPAVHAGVYLLLRIAPLVARAPWVQCLLVGVGVVTAVHSSILCRVQNDQKCALGYATMSQLGLMVAACGLGWWNVARWHLVAHVCLRTYQLLRAPSALRDAHLMRATNHGEPLDAPEIAPAVLPATVRRWAYHLGLERTHVETLLERWILHPILAFAVRADGIERAAMLLLTRRIEGGATPVREATALREEFR